MIRTYSPADEPRWLETRLLAFFGTDYYDDVKVAKTALAPGSIELVAEESEKLTGILDVELAEDRTAATIDTIAVHPAAQRGGIARQLLSEAVLRLPSSVRSLDAWTREDPQANGWYRAMGFVERHHYLHVYRSAELGDPLEGFETPDGLSLPVIAFMHAPVEREAELRARYSRVYVCRQYVLDL